MGQLAVRWKTLKDTLTRFKTARGENPLHQATEMQTFVLKHLTFLTKKMKNSRTEISASKTDRTSGNSKAALSVSQEKSGNQFFESRDYQNLSEVPNISDEGPIPLDESTNVSTIGTTPSLKPLLSLNTSQDNSSRSLHDSNHVLTVGNTQVLEPLLSLDHPQNNKELKKSNNEISRLLVTQLPSAQKRKIAKSPQSSICKSAKCQCMQSLGGKCVQRNQRFQKEN